MITEKGYIMYNYDECIYMSKNNIDLENIIICFLLYVFKNKKSLFGIKLNKDLYQFYFRQFILQLMLNYHCTNHF